jgi:cephalosporin hydroxylase
MTQSYLVEKNYTKVTVFHMYENPRNNVGEFVTQGGYESDKERDSAMTFNSTYDIAWIRPGREKSGTAKNIKRRSEINTKN